MIGTREFVAFDESEVLVNSGDWSAEVFEGVVELSLLLDVVPLFVVTEGCFAGTVK